MFVEFFDLFRLSKSRFIAYAFVNAILEGSFFLFTAILVKNVADYEFLGLSMLASCIIATGILRFVMLRLIIRLCYLTGAQVGYSIFERYKFLSYSYKVRNLNDGGTSIFLEKCQSLIIGFILPLQIILTNSLSIFILFIVEFYLLGIPFLGFVFIAIIFYGSIYLYTHKKMSELGSAVVKGEYDISSIVVGYIRGFKNLHHIDTSAINDSYLSTSRQLQGNRSMINYYGQFARLLLELLVPICVIVIVVLITNSDFEITLPTAEAFVVGFLVLQRIVPLTHQVSGSISIIKSSLPNAKDYMNLSRSISYQLAERVSETRKIDRLKQVCLRNVNVPWLNINAKYNFNILANKINLIIGASGSGKSTLLDIIANINTDYSGQAIVEDRGKSYDIKLIADSTFSYCSQDYALVSGTVREHLALTLGTQVPEETLAEMFGLLNLSFDQSFLNKNTSLLSGGEKQRLSLIGVLSAPASICVLDEPTSGLDAKSRSGLMKIILSKISSVTFIISSHDIDFISMIKNEQCNLIEL